MTTTPNTDILKKAIEKAVSNGLPSFIDGGSRYITIYGSDIPHGSWWMYEERIIFSHDFAKAFFGEAEWEYASNGEKTDFIKRGWQYHLQMMVLKEDPIKYLEKYL